MIIAYAVPGIPVAFDGQTEQPGPRVNVCTAVLLKLGRADTQTGKRIKIYTINLHHPHIDAVIHIMVHQMGLVTGFFPDHRFDKKIVDPQARCRLCDTVRLPG